MSRYYYEDKAGNIKMAHQTWADFLTNYSELVAPAIHPHNRKVHILARLPPSKTTHYCAECGKKGAVYYCEGCSAVNLYFHVHCAKAYHEQL